MSFTLDCLYSHNPKYQIFGAICHPIRFIKEFGFEKDVYPSLQYNICHFFHRLYIYLPFQKPCRWLGNMLCVRIADCKMLDSFSCRTRDKNIKYYFASCKFGHIKFSQVSYVRNGKSSNVFFDITVASLLNEEEGKKNAKETKPTVTVLYSGWVFTKKKAVQVFKEIIKQHRNLFISYTYPTANEPFFAEIPVKMLKLLKTGKGDENTIYDNNLEYIFNNTNDKIEKLWCYVTHLLTCMNDFRAHEKLANIHLCCTNYIHSRDSKDKPLVTKVDHKKYIIEVINDLQKYYLDEELDYYRI